MTIHPSVYLVFFYRAIRASHAANVSLAVYRQGIYICYCVYGRSIDTAGEQSEKPAGAGEL